MVDCSNVIIQTGTHTFALQVGENEPAKNQKYRRANEPSRNVHSFTEDFYSGRSRPSAIASSVACRRGGLVAPCPHLLKKIERTKVAYVFFEFCITYLYYIDAQKYPLPSPPPITMKRESSTESDKNEHDGVEKTNMKRGERRRYECPSHQHTFRCVH